MKKQHLKNDTFYQEHYTYDGNTGIERVRKYYGKRVVRDWLMFNSAREALDYFNNDIE